ncbi:MAG: DHH family phosphoesterase [Clostridia bacterium]|nr:DHH family phosphoesterase [Clostridia bacterium]
MSDYKALTLTECADRLLKIERPLVVMHTRPDGDTVGSGCALCELLTLLGKKVYYTCQDEISERLAFLTKGFVRTDDFTGLEAITIDVASPAQAGKIFEKLNIVLSIDHHAVNTPFCDHYTVGGLSSAGEALWGIAKELEARGFIQMTKKMAALLYASISSDTGGFIFSSATPKTYTVAAELMGYGIDHAEINRGLFHSKPIEQLKAEGLVCSEIKTASDGRIAYAVITKKMRDDAGLLFEHFECAIDVVRTLMGIQLAFVIKETNDGKYKASLRSTGSDVASVAAKHGGGGHVRAAGCTVEASSCKEAAEILLADMDNLLWK